MRQTNPNIEDALRDLSKQHREALDNIEAIYYTPTSPHYKNNQRYAWAVQEVDKKYTQLKRDLIHSYEKR